MAKIQLYIAMSLDGYIARNDGGLDWLDGLDNPDKTDYGYGDFITGIDLIIMGRKTYDIVCGFDMPWPYKDIKTYVVSRHSQVKIKTPLTFHLDHMDSKQLDKLRNDSAKNIWLMGGGELVSAFLDLRAVDEMILCLIPVILGRGIPLFPGSSEESSWRLSEATPYKSGAVILTYHRKEEET